jgi:hypothetical protein
MICSSEKRFRFMLWSSCRARANFKLDQIQGARSWIKSKGQGQGGVLTNCD